MPVHLEKPKATGQWALNVFSKRTDKRVWRMTVRQMEMLVLQIKRGTNIEDYFT